MMSRGSAQNNVASAANITNTSGYTVRSGSTNFHERFRGKMSKMNKEGHSGIVKNT